MQRKTAGLFQVLSAFGIWGVSPYFWRMFADVDEMYMLGWRIASTATILLAVQCAFGKLREIKEVLLSRKFFIIAAASFLLASNWLTYLYAMSQNRLVEASLGYFIAPLFTAAAGAFIERQTFGRRQMWSLAFLAAGVAVQCAASQSASWITVALAITFASYVALRKLNALEPLFSLSAEMVLLIPLALFLLMNGDSERPPAMLFSVAGALTLVPQLLFVFGLRSVPMNTIASAQYLSPTLTLLVGLFSGVDISAAIMLSFALIWAGILISTPVRFTRSIARAPLARDVALDC